MKNRKGHIRFITKADGSRSDGMFCWNTPKQRMSKDLMFQFFQSISEDYRMSAQDRLADIRESLSTQIAPYLRGPLKHEDVSSTDTLGARCHLNLSTGSGCYVVNPSSPPAIRNALDALHELDRLEHVLSQSPDSDQIVRSAIAVGQLIERFQLRMLFAPTVLSGRRAIERAAKGGKSTRALKPEQEVVALGYILDELRPGVSKTAACRRSAAKLFSEARINVSVSTLLRLLRKQERQPLLPSDTRSKSNQSQ